VGVGRSSNNSIGRACLNLISHDLGYAIADDMISFVMRPDTGSAIGRSTPASVTYGFTNSEICFVSLEHDSTGTALRAVREVHYYVRPMENQFGQEIGYRIMRGYWSSDICDYATSDYLEHCYWNTNWYATGGGNPGRPAGQTVAENVTALSFWCPDPADNVTAMRTFYSHGGYPNNHALPLYVDVYIEILNPDDARIAHYLKLNSMDCMDFVEKKVRRYTTRVFFHNRYGYCR